jgi:hypothetical protein
MINRPPLQRDRKNSRQLSEGESSELNQGLQRAVDASLSNLAERVKNKVQTSYGKESENA